MRSDRNKAKRLNKTGFGKFTRVWAVIYLILTLAFCGLVLFADLLALKYLIYGAGIIALITLLLFPPLYFYRFKKGRKILALILSFFIMAGYVLGAAYLTGTLNFFSKITNGEGFKLAKPVNVTRKSFNVYITGLDSWGNIDEKSRSDVNMIATVNPKTKTILLTSIPRDLYINVPGKEGEKDKLTHTGLNGAKNTIEAVEDLTGLTMNYYVKVDYATLIYLVNAIDGIEVHNDQTFYTNGQAADYLFNEGDIHLNGEEALAFSRERKSFADGDIQRNRNQQKVMSAILKKLTSSTTLLTNYPQILSSLQDYIEFNMSSREIKALVKMQQEDMSKWKIEKQNILGTVSPELMPCYALDGERASVLLVDTDSLNDAIEKINQVMKARK